MPSWHSGDAAYVRGFGWKEELAKSFLSNPYMRNVMMRLGNWKGFNRCFKAKHLA